MRIEYDPERDLLYMWFGTVGTRAAQTITVAPGVYADFDARGKLLGLEVLDAMEVLGQKVQFEIALPSLGAQVTGKSEHECAPHPNHVVRFTSEGVMAIRAPTGRTHLSTDVRFGLLRTGFAAIADDLVRGKCAVSTRA